jgi:hypothetical protein
MSAELFQHLFQDTSVQDNLKGRRQGCENTMQPTGLKGQEPESADVSEKVCQKAESFFFKGVEHWCFLRHTAFP